MIKNTCIKTGNSAVPGCKKRKEQSQSCSIQLEPYAAADLNWKIKKLRAFINLKSEKYSNYYCCTCIRKKNGWMEELMRIQQEFVSAIEKNLAANVIYWGKQFVWLTTLLPIQPVKIMSLCHDQSNEPMNQWIWSFAK